MGRFGSLPALGCSLLLGDDGLPVRVRCGRRRKKAAGLGLGRSGIAVARAGASGVAGAAGACFAAMDGTGVEWRLRASRVALEDGVIERGSQENEEEHEEEVGGEVQVLFEHHDSRDVDALLLQGEAAAALTRKTKKTEQKKAAATAATASTSTATTTATATATTTIRKKRKPPAYWASEENVRKEVEMFWAELGVVSNKVGCMVSLQAVEQPPYTRVYK